MLPVTKIWLAAAFFLIVLLAVAASREALAMSFSGIASGYYTRGDGHGFGIPTDQPVVLCDLPPAARIVQGIGPRGRFYTSSPEDCRVYGGRVME